MSRKATTSSIQPLYEWLASAGVGMAVGTSVTSGFFMLPIQTPVWQILVLLGGILLLVFPSLGIVNVIAPLYFSYKPCSCETPECSGCGFTPNYHTWMGITLVASVFAAATELWYVYRTKSSDWNWRKRCCGVANLAMSAIVVGLLALDEPPLYVRGQRFIASDSGPNAIPVLLTVIGCIIAAFRGLVLLLS